MRNNGMISVNRNRTLIYRIAPYTRRKADGILGYIHAACFDELAIVKSL